jgi:hypothetical protein
MAGLPGSGKSTIVRMLMEELKDISVTRHCTDDFYMVDGEYKYDKKKIKTYHAKNFEQFVASNAQVKINENTNTTKWEYVKYIQDSSTRGYICMVLFCQSAPLHVLARRNTHDVSEFHLKRMLKRYQVTSPLYYGLFVTSDQLPNHEAFAFTQTTPLHVTILFVGNKPKKGEGAAALEAIHGIVGQELTFGVTGVSINEAGKALVVAVPEKITPSCPHITLTTNKGYKPVQVGKMIESGKCTLLEDIDGVETPLKLNGIFAPMW